jgi:cytoskeletal protein RodZ
LNTLTLEDVLIEFGKLIHQTRLAKKMSLVDIEQKVKISQTEIVALEAGHGESIPCNELVKILKVLAISQNDVDKLFSRLQKAFLNQKLSLKKTAQ